MYIRFLWNTKWFGNIKNKQFPWLAGLDKLKAIPEIEYRAYGLVFNTSFFGLFFERKDKK